MNFTRIKNLVKRNGDKFILIENGEPEIVILPFSEYEKMTREDTDDIRWNPDEKRAIEDGLDFSSAGEISEEGTKTNDADVKTDDTLNDFISEVYKSNASDDFKDLRGAMGEREDSPPHEFERAASAAESPFSEEDSLFDQLPSSVARDGKEGEGDNEPHVSIFQRAPLNAGEETDFRPESVRLEDLPI